MSIQASSVLKILKLSSYVEITFKSLTSDNLHNGIYTLKNRNIGQSRNTETIVAWDTVNKHWQDIRVDTILNFVGIPD